MRIFRTLPAIIAALLITAAPLPAPAQFSVGVGFNVGIAPPALPVYAMPACPYANWAWTPGYWAWGQAGYYWVPGTWVAPPSVGVYWTPGYWGNSGGYYGWNNGYWGSSVGFYGGVNYGFGYYGTGFAGGVWAGNAFRYNTAVVNVNRTVIHNTYNKTVINNYNHSRVSYNGGHGGISARPTSADVDARRRGIAPTTVQRNQATVAGQDRNLYANVNKGKPPVTAVAKPISDPKQLPKYAPVTAADKQAAQGNLKNGNAGAANKGTVTTTNKGASANKGTMTTTNKGASTNKGATNQTMEHKAPVSAPKTQTQQKSNTQMQSAHKQPTTTGTHNQGAMHSQGNAYHQKPANQGKPPSGNMHAQSAGKPQGGQAKPAGGQGKPPSGGGGDKNKPPRA